VTIRYHFSDDADGSLPIPTIARIGPYRFFFYSNEGTGPRHIHVQREQSLAKFWLDPVRLAASTGFVSREINKIALLVLENNDTFMEKWNEFFGS
jgi:hypothetical protein